MIANRSRNNSYSMMNFKQKLFDKKILIFQGILNIMGLPYLLLSMTQRHYTESIIISFFSYALLFGMAIYIPISKFTYLNRKRQVDMIYSLPLTKKQLFLSDYASGLILCVVPYLLQSLLSFIISMIITFNEADSYRLLRLQYTLTSPFRVLYFCFVVTLLLIMLYTFTVFILSCTGNLFEAITASLYGNLLVPLFLYCIMNYLIGGLYSIQESPILLSIIECTSPLGGVIYLKKFYTFTDLISLLKWLIPFLIVTALYFYLAYRNCIKRRAEDITKPFIIRWTYHAILFMMVFIIACIMIGSEANYINLFLVITILFYIFETIHHRGVLKLSKFLPRYVMIVGSSILFLILFTKSEGFGIVYRKTGVTNLNSIELTSYRGIFNNNSYDIILSTEENINLVKTFQERMLEKHKETSVRISDNQDNFNYVSDNIVDRITDEGDITKSTEPNFFRNDSYHINTRFDVKTGFDYTRFYLAELNDYMLLAPIELSGEYIDTVIDDMIQRYTTNPNYYMQIADTYYLKTLDLSNRPTLIKELLENLRKDLKNISLSDYLEPTTSTGMILNFNRLTYSVNPNFTNTIAFLKEHNLWFEYSESDFQSILYASEIYLVSPEEVRNAMSNITDTVYYYSDSSFDDFIHYKKITELSEDVMILLQNASSQYVTKTPSYYLYANGKRFVIPSKFNNIAKQIYEAAN